MYSRSSILYCVWHMKIVLFADAKMAENDEKFRSNKMNATETKVNIADYLASNLVDVGTPFRFSGKTSK